MWLENRPTNRHNSYKALYSTCSKMQDHGSLFLPFAPVKVMTKYACLNTISPYAYTKFLNPKTPNSPLLSVTAKKQIPTFHQLVRRPLQFHVPVSFIGSTPEAPKRGKMIYRRLICVAKHFTAAVQLVHVLQRHRITHRRATKEELGSVHLQVFAAAIKSHILITITFRSVNEICSAPTNVQDKAII